MEAPSIRVHPSPRAARADLDAPGLAGYAFGRYAWLQAWHETLGASGAAEPAIVVVADARVRMVLPLGIARRAGLRVLEFLGGVVTDYNAPLVDPAFAAGLDAPAVQALWARIRAALPPHDVVRLLRMPATLDAPEGAGAAPVPNPLVHLDGARPAGLARSLALPETYGALADRLKRKFVTDTRRRRRRLDEVGPVTLTVAEDRDGRAAVIAGLRRMKTRRWRETGDRDWFAAPAFAAFYDALGRMDLPEGSVHCSSLTVSGTAVASHLGLAYRGRFYLLLLGWEAGPWHRFGTGRLIIDALIRAAIDDGRRAFDFTVGDEPYKQDWVDTALPLLCCERAVTMRGRVALAGARTRDQLHGRAVRIRWLRGAVRRLAGKPALPRTDQDAA